MKWGAAQEGPMRAEAVSWLPADGVVLFYDSNCMLCSRAVQWLLRHDRDAVLRFCPLNSEAGRRVAKACGLNESEPQSVVVVVEGQPLVRSQAARAVLSLAGCWPRALARLWGWMPLSLADWIYDAVASRRRWLGGEPIQCAARLAEQSHRVLTGDGDCQLRQ